MYEIKEDFSVTGISIEGRSFRNTRINLTQKLAGAGLGIKQLDRVLWWVRVPPGANSIIIKTVIY